VGVHLVDEDGPWIGDEERVALADELEAAEAGVELLHQVEDERGHRLEAVAQVVQRQADARALGPEPLRVDVAEANPVGQSPRALPQSPRLPARSPRPPRAVPAP
jgi:hypothetical protein